MDTSRAMGRSPDSFRLDEALAFAGKCVALEIYSPRTTPLRRIEAIGDTVEECLEQLVARGLDPSHFEYTRLKAPTRAAA
jgi:hypothetical protein